MNCYEDQLLTDQFFINIVLQSDSHDSAALFIILANRYAYNVGQYRSYILPKARKNRILTCIEVGPMFTDKKQKFIIQAYVFETTEL